MQDPPVYFPSDSATVEGASYWNQFSSVAQSYPTLCYPMDCSMPGFPSITNSQNLLKLMSLESVMPSNHLILCHPLPLLPSIFPSNRVFSNESDLCIRWPKYSYWNGSSKNQNITGSQRMKDCCWRQSPWIWSSCMWARNVFFFFYETIEI